MDDDAPDLVMRLYWDCQKLQERLTQLPNEREARRGAILAFLGQMEAKYPDTIPEFQPDLSWFNVAQSVNMASLQGTLPLLDFFTYCCVNCHHILPGWETDLNQGLSSQIWRNWRRNGVSMDWLSLVCTGILSFLWLSLKSKTCYNSVFVCSAKFEHERKDDNVRHAVQRCLSQLTQ